MKINELARTKHEGLTSGMKPAGKGGAKFSEVVMRQTEHLHREQIDKLMADIEAAGERLGKSRTFADLAKYKSLVKSLVKEAVDAGLKLKQSHSWNSFSEGKTYQTVEMIDQKLVELTEEVLQNDKQSIAILSKIGEIKGLLIHIYT